MRSVFDHQFISLVAASLLLVFGSPAHATGPDPLAYEFVITPEEGPLDPAVEKRYTPQFSACQKRAVSTLQNEACFVAEFARQDKALNRTWRMILGRVAPQRRALLVAAQRKWVAERDPFCNSKAEEFQGGTIVPVIYSNCRVEQTIRRAMWLQELR